MSLLIWYWHKPFYFHLYITFPLSWIPQPCDAPVQPPAQLPWAFTITHLPHSPSLALLIHHTIRPALCMECTGDLWTSLLHFPFWTGPHAVFLMIISFSDLPIHHRDMRQFHPVTRLTLMQANQSQVIALCSHWVRGLLRFHREWSLVSFFLDKSFCTYLIACNFFTQQRSFPQSLDLAKCVSLIHLIHSSHIVLLPCLTS